MSEILPLQLHLPDEAATRALGAALAETLSPGLVVHLVGELGAGKTTLVRGCLRALGYAGKVKSPTFTLVEPYTESRLPFYHFDLYRFKDPGEWRASGFGEYFDGASVCLVEWPERAGDFLPPPDLRIVLAHARTGRDATIAAHTDAGRQCLGRLRERYA